MNPYYTTFVYVVWILSTYFVSVLLLMLFKNKGKMFKNNTLKNDSKLPSVSIVISAYNEEKKIAHTMKSLLKLDYPKDLLQIIVVNDGSKDKTADIVKNYEITLIDNKINKGKAACLNQGISRSKGEFIVTMDADSVAPKNILKKVLPSFENKKIGAVTVPIEVKNPKNLLEKIIEIEYIIGLSVFHKILSFFDSMHVTPGPFSVYRKSLLQKLEGFDENSITEDLEIAYRIQELRYKIYCCTNTRVKTIIPNNLKGLYIQRKRWYSGYLLTVWKHKKLIFNKKVGMFGYFIPYNFTMVFFSLALFLSTFYIILSNAAKNLSFYSLTHFNFFAHFSLKEIDPLAFGIIGIFGVFLVIATYTIVTISLRTFNKNIMKRKAGFAGYFLMFFLYQLFWLTSFSAVLLARRIKWR